MLEPVPPTTSTPTPFGRRPQPGRSRAALVSPCRPYACQLGVFLSGRAGGCRRLGGALEMTSPSGHPASISPTGGGRQRGHRWCLLLSHRGGHA